VKDQKVESLRVEAVYESDELTYATLPGARAADGVMVVNGAHGYLLPPWECADIAIAILHQVAGLTLQAHIVWPLERELPQRVKEFEWTLPDGTTAPPLGNAFPAVVYTKIRDSGGRSLVAKDWECIQEWLDRRASGAPLWRLVLAEGHRERMHDARNVVLRCATALDVGVQSLLPSTEKFDLRLLRGELKKFRTPDLRKTDLDLFRTVERLWYTRHAIIHRAETNLYDRNPDNGAQPLRRLMPHDVETFLCAVPKVMSFVESNPP
jgi:hypothetical protein